MLSKLGLCFGVLLMSQVALAGNPFGRQQVILSGSHCVTPVQTFSSPVYSYSSPVVSSAHVTTAVATEAYSAATGGDDVSKALEVISRFKLQQRLLDDGLSALGYASAGQANYAVQTAPAVNFGLAPYAQGTTQFQVESLQVSSFGDPTQAIQENLNALSRLAENMNKNSATLGASVGTSVKALSDGLTAQAAGQVEVAKINAEAAARLAILQAAAQLVEQSRPSAQFDATIQRHSGVTEGETIEPSVVVESQATASVATVNAASVDLLQKTCYSCHSGENVKGNFTFDTQLSEEQAQLAVASVLNGSMPKNKPALSTLEKVQIIDALTGLAKQQ